MLRANESSAAFYVDVPVFLLPCTLIRPGLDESSDFAQDGQTRPQ